MKINPTSLTLNQLLGSANEQFVVPAYQRRYSWRSRQVIELIEDIDLLSGSDVHLLGSIVCLTGPHTAGLNRLELVDGQQRLTTLCVILECIKEKLTQDDEQDKAAELNRLLTAKPLGGKYVAKILLDTIDGAEFLGFIKRGETDYEEIANQNLANAFNETRSWIDRQDIQKIGEFLYKLQNQALVIRLDVSDAKDAFKLFETINNRGLRLSPTDIIKNFVLGNAARFGGEQLVLARKSWALLIKHLDGTDSDAFFRYFLISATKRRITNAQVIVEFKRLFMRSVKEASSLPERHLYVDEGIIEDEDAAEGSEIEDVELHEVGGTEYSFKQFISNVVRCANAYGEILLIKTGDKKLDRHLRNLRMIKSSQSYGLLMHLRVGGMDDNTFVNVLRLTENFILRRHVCRERANDTETLFAKLCSIDPKGSINPIKKAYREATPEDNKFKHDFANVNFTSNIIDRARYCLEQLEIQSHGKYQELHILGADDVHVEHIIPQKIKSKKAHSEFGDWTKYLGAQVDLLHPRLVSRIGNLTLFAGELNISASNNPFVAKQEAYLQSSISLTRGLSELRAFKFKDLEERSAEMSNLAVKRWPTP